MKKEIFSLGKDSIIYGMGSVITRFVGLITLPLFTAYLTPEEYGVIAMLALLTMVAQPVFSLGLSAAMGPSYFDQSDPSNKSRVVWCVFVLSAVSSLVLICLAWSFPGLLGWLVRLPSEYSGLVSLTLTGTALTILASSFMQRVQFEKQAKLYVGITVATALTAIVVSICTVVYLDWGVAGMVWGQIAGNLITFFAFFLVGIRNTFPSISQSVIRELLRLGVPMVPSFAFLFILMHANKYILEWQSGLDAVGIYSIGFNLGMAMSVVTGGIAMAWYPYFMSYMDKQEQAKIVFGRILTYYFFFVGLLCSAFFIFSKPITYLLTSEDFFSAYVVVGFVALSYFCQMLFNFFLPGLYYAKDVKFVSVIQGIASIISLPISYKLIESYSILGAALGVFLGNLLMAFFMYVWLAVNRSKYHLAKYEWKRVLCFVALAVLIVASYQWLPPVGFRMEVAKSLIFWVGAIGATLFLLNVDEKLVIFAMLKKKPINEQ